MNMTKNDIVPLVKNGIRYDLLQTKDIADAAHCLALTFSSGETIFQVLGITMDEFLIFSEILCKKAAIDGLSFVAKDQQTDQLVGCFIVEDFITILPESMDRVTSKFEPISTLLGQLDENYKKQHLVQENEILHGFMLGVYKDYTGKGIGRNLTQMVYALGKIKKYKGIIAEAIGPISQKIFYNQGYELIDSVKYAEFEFKQKKPFAKMTNGESCQLVYKKL